MVKPLSLLLPLAALASLVAATPPPDVLDSLSAAQAAAPTPHAKRASTFPEGRQFKQSAPVHPGPPANAKLVHRLKKAKRDFSTVASAGNETLILGSETASEAGDLASKGWKATKNETAVLAPKVEAGAVSGFKLVKNETETVLVPGAERGFKAVKNETTTVLIPAAEKEAGRAWREVEHLFGEARNATRRYEKEREEEYDEWAKEDRERAEKEKAKHHPSASTNATSPSTLRPAPPASGPPRPSGYVPSPSHNASAHLAPLDHSAASRLRLRKRSPGVLDDAASVREQVEAKLGIETRTAELVRESGKVTGDRNHYWYVDPSPAEDAHKAAHAGISASASARSSAAAARVSSASKAVESVARKEEREKEEKKEEDKEEKGKRSFLSPGKPSVKLTSSSAGEDKHPGNDKRSPLAAYGAAFGPAGAAAYGGAFGPAGAAGFGGAYGPAREKRQVPAAGPVHPRVGFEAAHQKALEAQASRRAAHAATRTSAPAASTPAKEGKKGSKSSSSSSAAASKASKSASKEASKESKAAAKTAKEHGKRAEAASSTAGFVTSTRPAAASSTAAAPAAESSSAGDDPSLLDPSTWGSAISGEASSTYDSLKKKVESLDLLSKIGLASLVLSSLLLLSALLYCCCKLRLRRRRRRAAERVNEKMMRAAQRENRGHGASGSFDSRATSIPMRSFGSASGPAGADAKDKKGKRRGSWKAFD